jgi:protein-tyrosine phosphatase
LTSKVLFVCLGNICRSPIAEGVFAHRVRESGMEGRYRIDSAGTGDWHCGEPPDSRAIAAATRRGVALPSVCRQVDRNDFAGFDVIIAMDRNNRKDLLALCPPALRGKIRLMREFGNPEERDSDVPDPYYGGPSEFDAVFEMLDRCCAGLLAALEAGTPATGDAATA